MEIAIPYHESIGQWLQMRHKLPHDWKVVYALVLEELERAKVSRQDVLASKELEESARLSPVILQILRLPQIRSILLNSRIILLSEYEGPNMKREIAQMKQEIFDLQSAAKTIQKNETQAKQKLARLAEKLGTSIDELHDNVESQAGLSAERYRESVKANLIKVSDIVDYYNAFVKKRFELTGHIEPVCGFEFLIPEREMDLSSVDYRRSMAGDLSELLGFVEGRLKVDQDAETLKTVGRVPSRSVEQLQSEKIVLESAFDLLRRGLTVCKATASESCMHELKSEIFSAKQVVREAPEKREELTNNLRDSSEELKRKQEEFKHLPRRVSELCRQLSQELSAYMSREIKIVEPVDFTGRP